MEEPKNEPVLAAEGIIHGLIVSVAYESAIQIAESYMPWLRLPVIKQVFEFFAKKFFEKLSDAIQDSVIQSIIDSQVNAQAKAYLDAAEKLKKSIEENNQDEIEKAKREFKEKLSKLIHYDGDGVRR